MSGSLFSSPGEERQRRAPLADRMRPTTLDEYMGQQHLVGDGAILRRLSQAERLPSLLFWGPPGTGKTTLARILAQGGEAWFEGLSAVSAGVADLRKVVAAANQRWRDEDQATVLFLDEIHRFNKAQQDAILPHVEDGTIVLMGATTENPSFEVIGPLLSRCRVFTLKPLEEDQLVALLQRALEDKERGLGNERLVVELDTLRALAGSVGGDARMALTVLEVAASSVPLGGPGQDRPLQRSHVEEALQHRTFLHDKKGDAHYDVVSAFIKSVRGSDVDATLYWLARMIEAGEEPLFIVRRMVILAAEDVGLADPRALMIATSCQQAVHFIGMPEGYLPMAECAIYLAAAPKSNSAYASYLKAREDARRTGAEPVPMHLRNAPTGLMKELGHGKDYAYAHDHEGHFVEQQYLPDSLQGRTYYEAGELGYEKKLKDWLVWLKGRSEDQGPSR